jgi:CO/xanthine dehydrogenase Mo-binding subunit
MQDFTGSPVDNAIAMQKYGVGQPVRRKEDDTLVRGKGKYTDDINLPGQLYAWIVRSPHAHGVIRGIDTEAAKAMPGVSAASGPAGISKPPITAPSPAACRSRARTAPRCSRPTAMH